MPGQGAMHILYDLHHAGKPGNTQVVHARNKIIAIRNLTYPHRLAGLDHFRRQPLQCLIAD
jgi:hypothetical protein